MNGILVLMNDPSCVFLDQEDEEAEKDDRGLDWACFASRRGQP